MPCGLVNAPATFQTIKNKILREFLDHVGVVYLDDIQIYCENMEEHITLVQQVLDWLEQHDLTVLLKKALFHQEEVKYLGYIVKTSGVMMSDRKVKSVQNWAHQRSVNNVQIFIVFANFYRLFIKDFSKIWKPITKTLKGNPKDFHLGRELEEAFEELQRRFNCLAFLPQKKNTGRNRRQQLCARRRIVSIPGETTSFNSRKLNSAERNYEIHDKELLTIMEAFREWRRYLTGEEEPITVYTDHQNLTSFLTKKIWNQHQIRWAEELTNYNFKIVYRPGC